MRKITSYCTCGHSYGQHAFYTDPDENGEASADCKVKSCLCEFWSYDSQLSDEKDRDAYEREMELRNEARKERWWRGDDEDY